MTLAAPAKPRRRSVSRPAGTVRALVVRQPWASLIADGQKTIETRSWPTRHRGPLLICAAKRTRYDSLPRGVALCTVELVDCRPMTSADEELAGCPYEPGLWAWVVRDARPLPLPFPVAGRLGLFDVSVPTSED